MSMLQDELIHCDRPLLSIVYHNSNPPKKRPFNIMKSWLAAGFAWAEFADGSTRRWEVIK